MTNIYRDARAQTIIRKMDVGSDMREQLPPLRRLCPALPVSLMRTPRNPSYPFSPVPVWDTINGLSPHRVRSENRCVCESVRENYSDKHFQQRVNSCIVAIWSEVFKVVFGKQPPQHCWEIPDLNPGSILACS